MFAEKSPCVASVSPEQPAFSHSASTAQQEQCDAGPDECQCSSTPAQQHRCPSSSMISPLTRSSGLKGDPAPHNQSHGSILLNLD